MKNKKTIGEVSTYFYRNYRENVAPGNNVLQDMARVAYLNDWEVVCDPASDLHYTVMFKSKTDGSDFYVTYMQNKCKDKLKFYLRKAKVENL